MQSKFQGTQTLFSTEYQHTGNAGIMCKHLIRGALREIHSAGILLSLVPTCHGRAQLGGMGAAGDAALVLNLPPLSLPRPTEPP